MRTQELAPAELRREAFDAITKRLGPSGLIRFLQDGLVGTGDYTTDRNDWLPHHSVRELGEQIRKSQRNR